MTFRLSEEQITKIDDWLEGLYPVIIEHEKKQLYRRTIFGKRPRAPTEIEARAWTQNRPVRAHVEYVFSFTGIGIAATVVVNGEHKLDITDYDNW